MRATLAVIIAVAACNVPIEHFHRPDADNTPPRVVSTQPSSGATDAERDVVRATFSKDVNPSTLDATTFVVTNNGAMVGGQVAYDADLRIATFTPDTQLTFFGSYQATITTGVMDLDGRATEADYPWTFTVRDGRWGTPELIETDDAGAADAPQVAIDAAGNAIVVWQQYDGTRLNIWTNRYVAGSGWGTAGLLETDNAGLAADPQVVVDGVGNALALWHQSDGTRFNIWASRYASGVWATPELMETDNAGSAVQPQVAIDAAGNAVAVWFQEDGTRTNIWAKQYTSGSWGAAGLIETDNAGFAQNPQVGVNAAGEAVVVWEQYDGTRLNISSNRYLVGSGWQGAALMETDNAGSATVPHVKVDAMGTAMAVWQQWSGTRMNIWANRSGPPPFGGFNTNLLADTGNAVSPEIAVDVNRSAIAVWYQTDGTRDNIWANRYAAGSGWQGAALIETDNLGSAQVPQVAVDATGNGIVVWQQSDGTHDNIWANRYVAGSGWQGPVMIETDNAGHARVPQVAVQAGGNAVAVWRQSDGTRDNIWASTFR